MSLSMIKNARSTTQNASNWDTIAADAPSLALSPGTHSRLKMSTRFNKKTPFVPSPWTSNILFSNAAVFGCSGVPSRLGTSMEGTEEKLLGSFNVGVGLGGAKPLGREINCELANAGALNDTFLKISNTTGR